MVKLWSIWQYLWGPFMGSLEFLFLRIIPTGLPSFHQSQSEFPTLTLVPAAFCSTNSLLQWAVPPCVPSLPLQSWGLHFVLCPYFSQKLKKSCWFFNLLALPCCQDGMAASSLLTWRTRNHKSAFHFCSFAVHSTFSWLFLSEHIEYIILSSGFKAFW